MDVKEAVRLLSGAALHTSVWADLGCGDGLFTRALLSLLPAESVVYAVDREPGITASAGIVPVQGDFVVETLSLPPLDGILMANSLHYVSDKQAFLRTVLTYFKTNPTFLIVEYDTDTPTPRWVPYPVSFAALQRLWGGEVTKLGEYRSRFGGKMYSALVRLR